MSMAFKMHRTTGTVGECVDEFVALKDVAMFHGRLSKERSPPSLYTKDSFDTKWCLDSRSWFSSRKPNKSEEGKGSRCVAWRRPLACEVWRLGGVWWADMERAVSPMMNFFSVLIFHQ